MWIESIPYWETRYYVPAVLRNLWVYKGLGQREAESLEGGRTASLARLAGAALTCSALVGGQAL